MTIEYKNFRTDIKATKDMKFEGYASVFGNVDAYNDIMQSGAFTKTIKENLARIKVLYMHDSYSVIGRPTKLYEDSNGLGFEADISNTTLGKDVFTLIKDKVITEMSIGYSPIKWSWDEEMEVRTLQEVRLWEISPVTWGANELAGIKGLIDLKAKYDKMDTELKRLETLISSGAGKSTTPNIDKPLSDIDPATIQSIIDRIKY